MNNYLRVLNCSLVWELSQLAQSPEGNHVQPSVASGEISSTLSHCVRDGPPSVVCYGCSNLLIKFHKFFCNLNYEL